MNKGQEMPGLKCSTLNQYLTKVKPHLYLLQCLEYHLPLPHIESPVIVTKRELNRFAHWPQVVVFFVVSAASSLVGLFGMFENFEDTDHD